MIAGVCSFLEFVLPRRLFQAIGAKLRSAADQAQLKNDLQNRADQDALGARLHPSWASDYRFIVTAAAKRFPFWKVWGSYIHDGAGYGVFVQAGPVVSCFQVRSMITVDGVRQESDLLELSDRERMDALKMGFDQMAVAIQKQLDEQATAHG